MNLLELKMLLSDHGYQFIERLTTDKEYYTSKGDSWFGKREEKNIMILIIPNPNHPRNMEFLLEKQSDSYELYDWCFGDYWFEIFNCKEEILATWILESVSNVMNNKLHVISARNAKNGKWFFDGGFFDSEDESLNDMDMYHDFMQRIKKKKSWIWNLTGRQDRYEIYTWSNYECIIK